MSKYVSNALFFLCTLAVLVLCFGEYIGANTISDITKEAICALPFGDYIWEAYLTLFESTEYTKLQIISKLLPDTFHAFTNEITHLIITWLIYRFVVRNAVGILMGTYTSGTKTIFDRVQVFFFYSIGFVIASLGAEYLVRFVNQCFANLGSTVGIEILKSIVYWIFNLGAIVIIIFVIAQHIIITEIIKTIIESLSKLLITAAFLMIIHFWGETKSMCVQLLPILIIGLIASVISDVMEENTLLKISK